MLYEIIEITVVFISVIIISTIWEFTTLKVSDKELESVELTKYADGVIFEYLKDLSATAEARMIKNIRRTVVSA